MFCRRPYIKALNILCDTQNICNHSDLWLVCLPMDREIWLQAPTRDIVLCSWARHFTLTVPFSSQAHKWRLSLEILGQLVRAKKRLNREEKQLGEENLIPIFFGTHLDLAN